MAATIEHTPGVMKCVKIKQRNKDLCQQSGVELGGFVRERLNEVIETESPIPTGQRTKPAYETVTTTIRITPIQNQYLIDVGANLSWFVDDVIEETLAGH